MSNATKNNNTQAKGVRMQKQRIHDTEFSTVPSAYGISFRSTKPHIERSKEGITITHSEFVKVINGSTDFSVTTIPINPGLSYPFQWLSRESRGYEKYFTRSMEFCVLPRNGTQLAGTTLLCFDYDASDDAPNSEAQAYSYRDAVGAASWQSIALKLDPNDLRGRGNLLLRYGSLSANQDITLRDLGNLYVITNGQSSTAAVGTLLIRYKFTLNIEQTDFIAPSITVSSGGTVSDIAVFGTAATYASASISVTASSSTLTFNSVGTFFVNIVVTGTGVTCGAASVSGGGSASGIYTVTNAASTSVARADLVEITMPGATVSYDASASTTVTSSITYISGYTA